MTRRRGDRVSIQVIPRDGLVDITVFVNSTLRDRLEGAEVFDLRVGRRDPKMLADLRRREERKSSE